MPVSETRIEHTRQANLGDQQNNTNFNALARTSGRVIVQTVSTNNISNCPFVAVPKMVVFQKAQCPFMLWFFETPYLHYLIPRLFFI